MIFIVVVLCVCQSAARREASGSFLIDERNKKKKIERVGEKHVSMMVSGAYGLTMPMMQSKKLTANTMVIQIMVLSYNKVKLVIQCNEHGRALAELAMVSERSRAIVIIFRPFEYY